MQKYFDGLALLLVTAWVGGMWAVGYIAAPVLFQALSDRALAGMLAGRMFTVMAYLGLLSAVYLLCYIMLLRGKVAMGQSVFWIIAGMLLLLLLGQFGLQPILADLKAQALPLYVMESPYADKFRLWHGVSSVAYLMQSLLGAVLLIKMYRPKV